MTGEPVVVFDGEATAAVLDAMEANMAAHMAYLPRFLPGATVSEEPELTLVDSGLPSDTINTICLARLQPDTADDRIAAAIAHFMSKDFQFAWWVGSVSRPADLGERLTTRGLVAAETEVGMALDLARLPATHPLPDGLVIRRVTTMAELTDFACVVAANWDPPDQSIVAFYERVAAAVLAPGCPARHYVGYLHGEPVATSEGFLGHGVAGIYAVVTVPPARRRGIGTAMTSAPLLDARAAGYRTATLQASADGQGVYARLGFLPCAEFREYKPGPVRQ